MSEINDIPKTESLAHSYKNGAEHLHDELTWANAMLLRYLKPENADHKLSRRAINRRVFCSFHDGVDLPLVSLVQSLGLSAHERNALVFLAAVELDTDFEETCAHIRAASPDRELTVGFISSVIIPDSLTRLITTTDLFSEQATLRRHDLVQVEPPRTGVDSHQRRRVCIAPRVLRYLLGDSNLPSALHSQAERRPIQANRSDIWIGSADLNRAFRVFEQAVIGPRRLNLCGPAGVGKKLLAEAMLNGQAEHLLFVNPYKSLGSQSRLEAFLRAARLESALTNSVLCLDFSELGDDLSANDRHQIEQFFFDYDELLLVASSTPLNLFSSRRPLVYQVPLPETADRQKLWGSALATHQVGLDTTVDVPGLAHQFPLTGGAIIEAAHQAARVATLDGRSIRHDDLNQAARGQLSSPLEEYAKRMETVLRWDDIVLSEEPLARIKKILTYAKTRPIVLGDWKFRCPGTRGVTALFSGPPGTGKTMIARVIAAEMGLELFKVDLANIVSKWVGETEKNLGKIFHAAEQSHAVLLFDEADSLFAKRTEVKSANDRYANLEVNYLLQRMEEYHGICILTTNLGTGIDDAFKRRLNVRVEFPFPDPECRARLWQQMIPESAPLSGRFDWEFLGRTYELSGGHIHNAVVAAASEAAVQKRSIKFSDLRQAAVHECRETGKLVRS